MLKNHSALSHKATALIFACILTLSNSLQALPADQNGSITNRGQRFTFVQNGKLANDVQLPLCEWYTNKAVPDGMVLAVHGLTLHGQSYEILARAFAAENAMGSYYVVAPDMRGFGHNRNSHQFCQDGDCKQKVDYEKTVDDLAKLVGLMKAKYPGVPLYLLGESLGSTVCLAVAARCPELVNGLVLSGTAVVKNSMMFEDPRNVIAVCAAVFAPHHRVKLDVFVEKLVSDDQNIVKEMENDPLIPKELTLGELIRTDWFTAKTISFAKQVAANTPVLILQGSLDQCVVPSAAVKLASHLRTTDQSMRWLYAYSHLLLETAYIRPATINAMTNWFTAHTAKHEKELETVQADLRSLGGLGSDKPNIETSNLQK